MVVDEKPVEGMLNTRSVSEALDIPQLEVIRRIRKGQIPAVKWGWNWVVKESDIDGIKVSEWYLRYLARRAKN